MIHRLSVASRVVALAALAAILACSQDQTTSPLQSELKLASVNPRNAHPPGGTGILSHDGAVITNGVVSLGVGSFGQLGADGSPDDVGLMYNPTGGEAILPGCECEGWGVANAGSGEFGLATHDNDFPSIQNLSLVSFASTATTATSVVEMGTTLRITHAYAPSVSPDLYEVTVTIENISGAPVSDLRYRRDMDWDVPPTEFAEFVTIETGTATAVLFTSDDGFASPNPLAGPSSILFTGEAVDSGPDDHGALFDFGFGALAAGATKTFTIFYGASATEAAAFTALIAVGAEVFSFGQPSSAGGASLGTPNTFIFAFKGVGGTVVPPPGGGGSGVGTCKGQPTSPGVTKFTFNGVTTFIGTEGDDVIGGTNGIDVVLGKGGDDDICTYNGIDTVHAGAGDDEVFGGRHGDFLFGLTGEDQLFGEHGSDRLDGGHTPVPSSSVDQDTDTCNGGTQGDKFFLCEVVIQ